MEALYWKPGRSYNSNTVRRIFIKIEPQLARRIFVYATEDEHPDVKVGEKRFNFCTVGITFCPQPQSREAHLADAEILEIVAAWAEFSFEPENGAANGAPATCTANEFKLAQSITAPVIQKSEDLNQYLKLLDEFDVDRSQRKFNGLF
jgi:hypothetical protein